MDSKKHGVGMVDGPRRAHHTLEGDPGRVLSAILGECFQYFSPPHVTFVRLCRCTGNIKAFVFMLVPHVISLTDLGRKFLGCYGA